MLNRDYYPGRLGVGGSNPLAPTKKSPGIRGFLLYYSAPGVEKSKLPAETAGMQRRCFHRSANWRGLLARPLQRRLALRCAMLQWRGSVEFRRNEVAPTSGARRAVKIAPNWRERRVRTAPLTPERTAI